MNPLLLQDSYKVLHHLCYKPNTTMVYSNLTPRSGEGKGTRFFGLQYLIKRYFLEEFGNWFKTPKNEAIKEYKRVIDRHLNMDIDCSHLEKLHDLQYLPLQLKALEEGSFVPFGVPVLTVKNTHPDFYWLPNFLETLISNTLWYPSTSCSNIRKLKELMLKYAEETGVDSSFVDYQLHEFSLRGHHSCDSGAVYGASWALNFKGSDNIPSIVWLEDYYNAKNENIINSVPASEHSIASSFGENGELEYINRMLDMFPDGIVSIVADTWSFPRFVTKILPLLKDKIMSRNGIVVIRPDSFWSNPQDCLCGYDGWHEKMSTLDNEELKMVKDGAIQTLWNMFGGTINKLGFKELDSHINVIYGEAWFHNRLLECCERLKASGFATKFIAGIGSWAALNVNRDFDGWAMKATAIINNGNLIEMFKDPITDKGNKKSLKGLLYVGEKNGELFVEDQVSLEKEQTGLLTNVFVDGKMVRETSLNEIRSRLNERSL